MTTSSPPDDPCTPPGGPERILELRVLGGLDEARRVMGALPVRGEDRLIALGRAGQLLQRAALHLQTLYESTHQRLSLMKTASLRGNVRKPRR